MGSIRIVVAEDDVTQAEGIASLVSQLRPSWQVQELVHTRAQLIQALDEVVPDVLLLDIHMPEQPARTKGVLEIVRANTSPPVVILITGDPSQALEAYESAVADYIVKPVRPARLAQALERAEGVLYARRARQPTAPAGKPIQIPLELLAPTSKSLPFADPVLEASQDDRSYGWIATAGLIIALMGSLGV